MESAQNLKVKAKPARFLCALACFALLSAGLGAFHFGRVAPDDFPVNTWTSWAIKEYLGKDRAPDLVFLGSSLMLVPLDGVDADFLNRRVDGARHHKSLFFEDKFKAYSGGKKLSTYNFALPGEMPSDAALITEFLLKGKKTPKLLVYGVGPRDFIDNTLPSPQATDPFRYLSRFGDWSSRIDLIVPEWQERLNYELGHLFYPYGKRQEIVQTANKKTTQFCNNLLSKMGLKEQPKVDAIALRRKLVPEHNPFEINPNECFFRPVSESPRPDFADNVAEYAKRYKTLKRETFEGQMQFMSDILSTARQRGIHAVVVAMPITQVNRNLLSDDNWELYKTRLKAIADHYETTFYDMHASGIFKFEDFQDTVHLHAGGGAKLLDEMAKVIANDEPSMAALGLKNNQENRAVAGREEPSL
jgi:hypothetical protein